MTWLRSFILFTLGVFFGLSLKAEIVINEVCYDPVGSDEGFEWIELYNNGSTSIQLEGAKILSGGSSYALQYTLPFFELRPHRYLLIGGASLFNAQLNYNFSFQNGGSETDGIRYVSPDGTYTDTVLYDSPNSNQLFDDYNLPGTHFAPDVPAGYSLARIYDGYDTNNCETDFIAEAKPTPGLANRIHCDYALGTYNILQENNYVELDLCLKNLSPFVPLLSAELTITQNSILLAQQAIAPIPAWDSLRINLSFTCNSSPLTVILWLVDDPDSTNNILLIPLNSETQADILINEFLANPESGNQEWIEIYGDQIAQGTYYIADNSTSKIRFVLPAISGYFVICQNPDALLLRYPECPAGSIILAESWTYLNNDGDCLVLKNETGTLDSLIYTGEEIIKGVSRERVLVESTVIWQNCYNAKGGTPGLPNSIMPQTELPDLGKVVLTGSPCDAKAGEKIALAYNFPSATNRITCNIYDLSGRKICSVADYALVNAAGVIYWNGCKQDGNFAPRGLYIILWESQNAAGGKIMRKQFTAVLKG
ncbi:MAG TPA: lamin tail domain-containing protein [Candidatus Cloacimonas sp.]|nr:lamin tail domain-containing protein [Candidatus Cloacimonas sp.]